jgi:prolyl-tRNA editing enzyme YbaK/EbsC (Cys-tRNA(Pro) deacylase)
VGQIVKSLVFVAKQTRRGVLILASGSNRVDEKKIAALLGEKIEKADADFVRVQTGFAIGGVPPIGHTHPMQTVIDEDLLQYEMVWAAAGMPNAVFKLVAADLLKITDGKVSTVKLG